MNILAYALRLSTYLLLPSAYIVSKARLDFPLPESPVITARLSLGISRSMFFRLFSRAPFIRIFFIIAFSERFNINENSDY